MMDKSYVNTFSIAGIRFSLHTERPIIITEPFKDFITENDQSDIKIEFKESNQIELKTENEKFSNLIFKVYENDKGYYRIYHDHKEDDRQYAIGRIYSNEYEKIQYLTDSSQFFNESSNAFSHIAFEELLLRWKAMILHASFISTEQGGILFSGPSGIGKSTQADLWRLHEEAELINGDRTIIRKDNNMWRAYGSPYAGSSRCFVNKSVAIRAIVILKKCEKCRIQKMNSTMAFFKTYAGMIVNTWNQEYVQTITDLLKEMILEIPVYLLECTPTKEAVDLLKNTLEKEETGESRRNTL